MAEWVTWITTSGNEPTTEVVSAGPGFNEPQIAVALAIAKKTPGGWNKVSSTTRSRADLIMKAFWIARQWNIGDITAGTPRWIKS